MQESPWVQRSSGFGYGVAAREKQVGESVQPIRAGQPHDAPTTATGIGSVIPGPKPACTTGSGAVAAWFEKYAKQTN